MSASDFTEKKISSTTVYQGKLLTVKQDQVSLPDGGVARRETIVHPGAVVIIAVMDNDTVLLERQYRYSLQRHFYELPAGKIEPNEDTLATAKRELIEETGYSANQWQHLTTLYPCVGYSNERIELYYATGLNYCGMALDDGEFLEVLKVPFATALQWVQQGKIMEAKTILGLLWAEKIKRDKW
jgi:ADP-ribose pyrophosphatase